MMKVHTLTGTEGHGDPAGGFAMSYNVRARNRPMLNQCCGELCSCWKTETSSQCMSSQGINHACFMNVFTEHLVKCMAQKWDSIMNVSMHT